jgi:CMP/dCMP kinase
VVMDGRDIGTVVLPDADIKVFLTASLDERARRRANEFSQCGISIEVGQLAEDMKARDTRDETREVAPLRPADDAHHIDSTGKTIDQVVDEILALME